jgi:hypothetical protein
MFNTRETHISHSIYEKGRSGHSLLTIESDDISFSISFFLIVSYHYQREREKISIVDPDLLYIVVARSRFKREKKAGKREKNRANYPLPRALAYHHRIYFI